jgi:hypothetical protein
MEESMSDTVDDTPAPLPPDVLSESEPPSDQGDLPLHLRVLKAIVEGQADPERVDRALALANEVYELETANVALENYRSAS